MFISKKEKDLLTHKIASLELSVSGLYTSLRFIEEKLHAMKPVAKPAKKKKVLTEAQRIKQRAYAKAYVLRKKAEKAAKLAQVVA
jgi:hypothetical protein